MVAFNAADPEAMAMPIMSAYRQASGAIRAQGRSWYPDAERFARSVSAETGASRATVIGIIAALSPRIQWSKNKSFAARHVGGEDVPVLPLSAERAGAIRSGATPLSVLGGPKTRAFYRNIMGATDPVTVDCHTMAVANWTTDADAPTHKQYRQIADAYRIAARECGETPRSMQAIVWIVARGRSN